MYHIFKEQIVKDPVHTPTPRIHITPTIINILLALVDGEKHGFAILLKVEANTNGQVKLGPGLLYSSIKNMLKAGYIEQSDERVDPDLDDQRRRHYRLTGIGRHVLNREAARTTVGAAATLTIDLSSSVNLGGPK
jgi:DNA-binding PadR family transcriptional regulator